MSVLWGASAAPAAAWGDSAAGYGTHDWIVDQALAILDHAGKRPAWFDRDLALAHTDDPDTLEMEADHSRDVEHVYRDTAKRGGAVQRIADHYGAALDALDAEDWDEATYQVAMLSHFLADISQPWHSAAAGLTKTSSHYYYELAVQRKTTSPTAAAGWADRTQAVSLISNIRRTAAAEAAYSRARFAALYDAWIGSDGSITNATVSRLTGEVLRRAARDLANVIWSIDQGRGRAPDVASLTTKLKWVGVKNGEPYQALYTWAKDAAGNGIEGLQVNVSWPNADGSRTAYRTWTDAAGYVKLTLATPKLPLLRRQDVPVTVSENGITTRRTPWFIPSPRLASGAAGFKTVVNDSTPDAGQTVRITSLARDTAGRPVKGLLVTWTLDYGSRTIRATGITNEHGKAYAWRTITSATTSRTVKITAHVQSASSNRYSYASFNKN
jgi:hypothetical protein